METFEMYFKFVSVNGVICKKINENNYNINDVDDGEYVNFFLKLIF